MQQDPLVCPEREEEVQERKEIHQRQASRISQCRKDSHENAGIAGRHVKLRILIEFQQVDLVFYLPRAARASEEYGKPPPDHIKGWVRDGVKQHVQHQSGTHGCVPASLEVGVRSIQDPVERLPVEMQQEDDERKVAEL